MIAGNIVKVDPAAQGAGAAVPTTWKQNGKFFFNIYNCLYILLGLIQSQKIFLKTSNKRFTCIFTVNNGTELWEANLRNGGQPATPAVQKTPWGHTPSTNLGGTWGEDDDGGDSANVWTGSQSNQATPQQWNQPSGSNAAVNVNAASANVGQNAAMWPPAAGSTGTFYVFTVIKRNVLVLYSKEFK